MMDKSSLVFVSVVIAIGIAACIFLWKSYEVPPIITALLSLWIAGGIAYIVVSRMKKW